ncbi:uncharacterized protein LOC141712329 [Apium graveolens]|uniref:uncharacterized protein LOC141712329 n=1 Tax=Apium graveolens TaxID=4045 RepID=UPI003D7A3332
MIIGSIDGLICYTPKYNSLKSVFIWNPAIRKLKILPKSKFYKKEALYGFLFDANANDFKVAKINYKIRCNVEVYSLSTNSWDLIATGGPNLGICIAENVIHVANGTLYWLILRGFAMWLIISYNLCNGIFRETSRLICCVRVYDEGLNELYKIELRENEKLSALVCIRNSVSNEVLFRDCYYSADSNVMLDRDQHSSFFHRFGRLSVSIGLYSFIDLCRCKPREARLSKMLRNSVEIKSLPVDYWARLLFMAKRRASWCLFCTELITNRE